MLAKRIERYRSVLAIIIALIVLIIGTLVFSIYMNGTLLPHQNEVLTRSASLAQRISDVGPETEELHAEILAHLKLVKAGGKVQKEQGQSWNFAGISDAELSKTADQLEVIIKQRALQRLPSSYQSFLQAHQNFYQSWITFTTILMIISGLLILLGFAWIVFILANRLGAADAKMFQSLEENKNILAAINEGIFLIDPDFNIGTVQSAASREIFGTLRNIDGSFFNFIEPFISADDLVDAKEYVSLLSEGKGRQSLIVDLNPLQEVESIMMSDNGEATRKYLSFNFSRSKRETGTLSNVLVSVRDITQEVELKRELEAASDSSQERFKMLMGSLNADPRHLSEFYDATFTALQEINESLRDEKQVHSSNMQKLDEIYRKVHKIKGNAAAVGMTLVETAAHEFESKIDSLKETPSLDGKGMLSLTVHLKKMIGELEFLKILTSKFNDSSVSNDERSILSFSNDIEEIADTKDDSKEGPNSRLEYLANEVAKRSGKNIQLEVRGFGELDLLDSAQQDIESLCVQLVRNSVVHGVEAPDERLKQNKSSKGQITLSLVEKDAKSITLTVRDDGAGLDFDLIKSKAIEKGLLGDMPIDAVKVADLVRCIFKPGFSTRDNASMDSGRGYGLDIVAKEVKNLGGSVAVKSSKGLYSQFTITLPRSAMGIVTAS